MTMVATPGFSYDPTLKTGTWACPDPSELEVVVNLQLSPQIKTNRQIYDITKCLPFDAGMKVVVLRELGYDDIIEIAVAVEGQEYRFFVKKNDLQL
ncbi:MAG TPA: hypothetical protein VGX71_25505 [Pseudaminobacter sp.]|nr:hypothetical protein [Pseudaminobacter sp.]